MYGRHIMAEAQQAYCESTTHNPSLLVTPSKRRSTSNQSTETALTYA